MPRDLNQEMNIIEPPPLPEIRVPKAPTIDPIIPDEPGPLGVPDEAILPPINNLDTPAAVAHISIKSIEEVLNFCTVFFAEHIDFGSFAAGSEMPITVQISCLFNGQASKIAINPDLIIGRTPVGGVWDLEG
jgi:hypothetical protein